MQETNKEKDIKPEENRERPKKIRKKNRKLLFQIGLVTVLYSVIAFVGIIMIFYTICIFIYSLAKQDQLAENMNRIERTVFRSSDYNPEVNGAILDILEKDPEEIKNTLIDLEFYNTLTDEDWNELNRQTELCGGQNAILNGENLVKLPEKLQLYLVKQYYLSFFYQLMAEQEAYRYENLSVIDLKEGTVLFHIDADDEIDMEKFWTSSEWNRELVEREGIGEVSEDVEEIREIIRNSEWDDRDYQLNFGSRNGVDYEGKESMTGYHWVKVDGEKRLCISLTYRLADFQDTVVSFVAFGGIALFPGILISEVLLLVFIYFISVRPLRKEKNALAKYVEDKDSEAVVKAMGKIRQRNEFGVLADDISILVKEIDRYMKENVHLAAEKEKVATELELASRIQKGMLRKDFPDTPKYEIYALMDPAKEVGGDFYDFFEVDATHLAIVIGDVSGKGVPGSLFMMKAQTVIRDKTLAGGTPAEIMEVVNNELVEDDVDEMFVTIWLGILDLNTGIISAVNAGHEYPILKTGERFELLEDPHGFVAGGMEGMKYKDYEINLGPEGIIFIYTDGVPEATRTDEKMYGTDRLVERLNRDPGAMPKELVDGVEQDVAAFVGDAEQFDDLTILCLSYRCGASREET